MGLVISGRLCRRPGRKPRKRAKEKRGRSDSGKKRLRWGSEGLIVDSRANAIGAGNPTKVPCRHLRQSPSIRRRRRRPASVGALLSAMRTFSIELPASIARYPPGRPNQAIRISQRALHPYPSPLRSLRNHHIFNSHCMTLK